MSLLGQDGRSAGEADESRRTILNRRPHGGSPLKTVTWFPYPIQQTNVFNFPKYSTKATVFAKARSQLVESIEKAQ